ncbi:uncharacterized protein LOC127002499 [Eriocheir sinensis]|uniref:uncharacterized protein LOC127002499 n=1 Tax=Eriocheir sinensis TaxID=95602 RepID=UPI0021C661AB|nr:uncharacterized protein LOC127002499 [Eriocheir sinensis]
MDEMRLPQSGGAHKQCRHKSNSALCRPPVDAAVPQGLGAATGLSRPSPIAGADPVPQEDVGGDCSPKLRTTPLSSVFLRDRDPPYPDYPAPPPWAAAPFTTTIRPLPARKALLVGERLTREAMDREKDVARPYAHVYYSDGSISHHTRAVGAAFVTAGHTAMFRLPEGCSFTQVELVAIHQALRYAVEEGRGDAILHCDSVPAIQSLHRDPLADNATLLTSIHVLMRIMEGAGRHVAVNWIPSHAGVPGNEAAY